MTDPGRWYQESLNIRLVYLYLLASSRAPIANDKSDIPLDIPIYETESLTEAVLFCYNLGKDFTVRTYAEWEERESLYASV